MTTTCQSRVNYGQPSQIKAIYLCAGNIINQTLSTSYTFKAHSTNFVCKIGIGNVKVESGDGQEMVGVNPASNSNEFENYVIQVLIP